MPGQRTDPAAVLKFAVSLESDLGAVFNECAGLQLELEVLEYQEGGLNTYVHKRPGRLKQANMTLRRGIVTSDKLLKWVIDAFSGRIERKNVDVTLYTADGKKTRMWSLYSAYPVKWIGPALKAGDNSIAVDTFELAYEEMRME